MKKLRGKTQVLLDRYKEISEKVEERSSLILISRMDHVLQINQSHYSIPHSITILLNDFNDVFLKEFVVDYPLFGN